MFLCLKVVQHVVNQVWCRKNRLQNTVHETRIANIAQSDRDMMSHPRSCITFLSLITLLVYIGMNIQENLKRKLEFCYLHECRWLTAFRRAWITRDLQPVSQMTSHCCRSRHSRSAGC